MHSFLTPITQTHFERIGSTNSQLIDDIVRQKCSHTSPHLYTADHQTQGRGQHGRTWLGDVGNVYLSVYVAMGQGQFDLHALSGLMSLAVGFELAHLPVINQINTQRIHHALPPIGVKWANDIGFYDSQCSMFNKLAGILIEPVFKTLINNDKKSLVGVVIGVGLNVTHAPLIHDGLYKAVCLNDLDPSQNSHANAKTLYAPITNAILKAVQRCNRCQDANHQKAFIDAFNKRHLLNHQTVCILSQHARTSHQQGYCLGIGQEGELLLQNDHGIERVFAGMAQLKTHNKHKDDL